MTQFTYTKSGFPKPTLNTVLLTSWHNKYNCDCCHIYGEPCAGSGSCRIQVGLPDSFPGQMA